MLSIFRTNQFIFSGLLIVYVLLLHAASLVLDPVHSFEGPTGALWLTLCENTQLCGGSTAQFISIMLVFIQALILNAITAQLRLYGEFNQFAGVAYVLLACLYPEFLLFSPILLGNTFFVFALFSVVHIHLQASSADWVFNTGFWIGLASLCYPPFLFLGIWAILGLSFLQRRKFRERIMLLLGAATPYIMVGSLYFYFDQWPFFFEQQFGESFAWLSFAQGSYAQTETFIKAGFFLLLLLVLLLSYTNLTFKKSMQSKRTIDLLYFSLLIIGLGATVTQSVGIDYFLLAVPPLALLLGLALTQMPSRWAELLHIALLLGGILLHFKPILLL